MIIRTKDIISLGIRSPVWRDPINRTTVLFGFDGGILDTISIRGPGQNIPLIYTFSRFDDDENARRIREIIEKIFELREKFK